MTLCTFLALWGVLVVLVVCGGWMKPDTPEDG